MDDVERCFVHLDYEFEHKPEHVGGNRPEVFFVFILFLFFLISYFFPLFFKVGS